MANTDPRSRDPRSRDPRGEDPGGVDLVETDLRRRSELERHAATLLLVAALTMAIICGAVIVSGWFAGVLVDKWERVFWAGALLGGLMVSTFAAAAAPSGRNPGRSITRISWLTRAGLVLFVISPALCVLGLAGNFYRL